MRKNWAKRAAAAVLGLALAVGMGVQGPVSTGATSQEDIDKADQAVEEQQQKVDELNRELDEIHGDISDTKKYISELDGLYSDYASQVAGVQSQVSAKQEEIDAKLAQIDDKKKEIEAKKADIEQTVNELTAAQEEQNEQYEAMKLRIQYMYECGEESFLDLIFTSENLGDMLGRTEYISSITSYDRNQLKQMIETKNQIADMLVRLEQEEDELEKQEASLEEQKNDLEGQKAELVELQRSLEAQQSYVNTIIGEKERALSDMQNSQESTQTKLDLAEQELAEQKAFAENMRKRYEEEKRKAEAAGIDPGLAASEVIKEINSNGGFSWPLPGYSYISSPYGYRNHPITGAWSLHDGTDICGGDCDGKPIVAAYTGTVILSEYYYGYGNTIQISHGTGVVTQYSHCSSLAVSVGDTVTRGQTIAYVGMSGNATGPHLHFGLYIEGSSVDAMNYVSP